MVALVFFQCNVNNIPGEESKGRGVVSPLESFVADRIC